MRTLARWSSSWIAVAVTLSACGGGDEKPAPVPLKFTAAMIEGKTFYQEDLSGAEPEKGLATFTASAITLWRESTGGPGMVSGTWSIDADGKLMLQLGPDHITVTLYVDATTYLDVVGDDGTGPSSQRLYKTVSFGSALPDRFTVADRDLAGVTHAVGVAAFGAGTGVFTDGFNEDGTITWAGRADGSISLSSANEDNVLYLRADSSAASPKSLRVVGLRYDAGTTTFTGMVDTILTETPAKSGFTAAMVEGKAFFRDSTPVNRSIVRYVAGGPTGGDQEEWYEDTISVQHRLGTWTLTPLAGSIRVLPTGPGGLPELAAMLVEDAATHWNLLVNTGTPDAPIINPAVLEKTVAVTAAQWFTYTWSVVHFAVTGSIVGPYQITIGDGTGTDPYGQPFTWVVRGDGSIGVTWPNSDTLTIYQRATSAPPNRFETAGIQTTGSTTSLRVQRYTR